MGGRRRRMAKRKTMKGGNFYGAEVDSGIGSAGLGRPAVPNTANNPVTGAVILDGGEMNPPQLGGRRRRRTSKKTRKGGRKSKKVGRKGRKTMRGGSSFGNVGYGFGGSGIAGTATFAGYNANVGAAPTGGDGVARLH
jgi:hypothetical protein